MSGVAAGMTGDGASRNWRTSSRSYGNGQCVEVAGPSRGGIQVRDSANLHGPVLRLSPAGWTAFVGDIRGGSLPAN